MDIEPDEVFQYIEAISYPASKERIINTATNHNATDEVIMVLQRLPEKDYGGAEEVSEALESLE